jgi:hypothetical protein
MARARGEDARDAGGPRQAFASAHAAAKDPDPRKAKVVIAERWSTASVASTSG